MEKENTIIPQSEENASVPESEENTVDMEAEKNDSLVQTADEQKTPESRCPNCQALLKEGQAFCTECGAVLKKKCQRCGADLPDGHSFCSSCGERVDSLNPNQSAIDQFNQNITNKSASSAKKKMVLPILGIIALIIVVISYMVIQHNKVEKYKEDANTFCMTVLTAAANLEDIGNEIQNEWHDYIYDRWSIYDSIDDAVAGALLNKATEIDTAETQKSTIDSLYSRLKKPVNDDNEITELCEAVKVLYDEYEDLYDCVTDPSGNYTSFRSNFSSYDSSVVDAYEDLKDLCDIYN